MLAIWEYAAENDVVAADRMVDRFTIAFERITTFPEAGTLYPHDKGDFRFVVIAPYLIFYRIVGTDIDIIRILHSARRWETLL